MIAVCPRNLSSRLVRDLELKGIIKYYYCYYFGLFCSAAVLFIALLLHTEEWGARSSIGVADHLEKSTSTSIPCPLRRNDASPSSVTRDTQKAREGEREREEKKTRQNKSKQQEDATFPWKQPPTTSKKINSSSYLLSLVCVQLGLVESRASLRRQMTCSAASETPNKGRGGYKIT